MAFTLDTPPGITDIPDSLLGQGSLASGFTFSALKENAAFGSVVPEVFFGTYANGQRVPLPISPADGYQYEQSELLYCWEVYNTLPSAGATPSAPGALRACEWYVDQLTGTIHTMENYVIGNMKGGGTTADGILGVWTVGIRGRTLRTLSQKYSSSSPIPPSPPPGYTDIPNTYFAEDNAATQTNLQKLSYNTKLGSVQCEVFMVNPSNAPVWQPDTSYSEGQLVQPSQAHCNGFWFIAANNGTSGTIEPNWPSLFRNPVPVSDGGIIWNSAGCGFLNGQQVEYPQSEIDGYQYSSQDVIVPHLSFISTESFPVQFFSGVIDSSAPYPAGIFMKDLVNIQAPLPTAITNRNFASLLSRLNGGTTKFTVLPPTLQLGASSFVPPPAMGLSSSIPAPGSSTTGVGIVQCGVQYNTGLFSDGTVMVTLFCFRNIGTMTPNPDSSPAGQTFTDFSTIAMTTGNPLPGNDNAQEGLNPNFYMGAINENAKFSILRPEVFYCSYVPPPAPTTQTGYNITSAGIIAGGQVPIPKSPTDGYQYSREELTYLWWFTASAGVGGIQEQDFALYVDPQSGVINSTVEYIGLNGSTSGTNDSNLGTIIYGAGGLLQYTNASLANAPLYGQIELHVIIFAQRQHETELQPQVIYSTTGSAAQPSSNNLIPNGNFEIWSTPNPNYAEITGTADDWFVNWEQGATDTTDMGVTTSLFQFPGQNALPGSGPSAPYGALGGSFSQCLAVIPSCQNNNAATDPESRKHVPLQNGSATLSIVSEIIPINPGGEYALGFLAAVYATTDFSPTGSTGDPEAGVSPDYIGAGFYARVHMLGQNQNGNGQPDMSTDTVFELLCDAANGASLGLPAGLLTGTNNGYGIYGAPGNFISPPACEQFNFTFTIPATAGVSGVPVAGTLEPGNSITPAGYVPSRAFNYGPTAANPNNSAICSTGLPATGPQTIDFIPAFVYVEFLLWDIWGTGFDHLRVAVIDNVNLQDLTSGTSTLLQLSNLGTSTALQAQGNITGYGGLVFTYASTDNSITVSWNTFNLLYQSGTSLPIPAGSYTFLGLSASTTYDIGASLNINTFAIGSWTIKGPTTIGADTTFDNPTILHLLNADNQVGLLAGGPGAQATTAAPSGSGSGGGGTPRPGCPSVEMFTRDGESVGELKLGDILDCLDGPAFVEHAEKSIQPCVRLSTAQGHSLIVSESTPFTLPDGKIRLAPFMHGEMVATDKGSGTKIEWQKCEVVSVGIRKVAVISAGGRTFAAGETPKARIYSHNYIKAPG